MKIQVDKKIHWAKWAVLPAIVVVGVVAFAISAYKDHGSVAMLQSPAKANPTSAEKAPTTVAPAVAPSLTSLAVPARPGISLSTQVNQLVATGKPADAYLAYRISANCQLNTEWRSSILRQPDGDQISKILFKNVPALSEICGDLSPGQIASRVSLLRIAAQAGVHGAITALVTLEGPEGIFRSIPDSEDFRQLQAVAAEAALRTADPDALQGKSDEYFNSSKTPENIALALKYWVASKEARSIDAGKPAISNDSVVARYSSILPPEVAERAIADGKTLVATARSAK